MGDATENGANGSELAARCQGLVVTYGDVTAVDGLDLDVRRGECFGLLGPNGAGKTTTVEVFEGLKERAAGVVEVLGCRWGQGHDRALRERLGIALQETRLSEVLTVRETVRLFASFYEQRQPIDDVIALLGLTEKRDARVGKLSGGQRQRLSLACALVGDPELLFLDEPTTGLDPQARMKIWEIVEEFKQRGGTVILTTHYMEEAARLCDRVAIIDHGRRIALDTPDRLIHVLGAEEVIELKVDRALALGRVEALPGVQSASVRGELYVLVAESAAESLPPLLELAKTEGAAVAALATHRATLDDVFVHLTGRGLRDG